MSDALEALARHQQFVLYRTQPSTARPGKTDKIPCGTTGSACDAHNTANWMDAVTASAAAQALGLGVGFVLTSGDPFFCLDIDGCRETNGWSAAALSLVERFPGAAVEVSQSGNGLHIWGRYDGPEPAHSCRNAQLGAELYTSRRFIALGRPDATGDASTVCTSALAAVIAEFFPPATSASPAPAPVAVSTADPVDDEALIARMLAAPQSASAAFGGKLTFAQLWEADADALARAFPDTGGTRAYDASRADAALAKHLAFWCAKDAAQMERLMRASGLMRDKYDRPDYLARTIAGVIAMQGDVYRPQSSPTATGWNTAPFEDAAIRAPRVSVSDLFTSPPEPQRFRIEGILPGGVVTLLGAHGGTGKSMLALIAAVCLATGKPFMGMPVEKCRVAFFSGEDPAPVVRRRLSRICRHMGIDPHELSSNLLMLDATEQPVLYNGSETRALAALRLDVEEFKPGAIIIDNASDTYDANEIERARVREFIRLLAALGKADNAAVLLLAHIDKQTARGGNNTNSEGYSGSTAWHNSARSRLFLSARDEGLMLEHQKSNFGLRCDPVFMRWTGDGLLERADTPGGVDDRATILRLIGELYRKGVYVSPASNSANNAFKVLQPLPEYPRGLSRHGLAAVIQALLVEGAITMESYSTGQRNTRQRYALSALSVRQVGLNAPNEQHTRPVAVCVLGGMGDTQRNETALDIAGGMQRGS